MSHLCICKCKVNTDNKEDTGIVRYGDVIAVKASAGKDRFLSSREGKIGFWRNLMGLIYITHTDFFFFLIYTT